MVLLVLCLSLDKTDDSGGEGGRRRRKVWLNQVLVARANGWLVSKVGKCLVRGRRLDVCEKNELQERKDGTDELHVFDDIVSEVSLV